MLWFCNNTCSFFTLAHSLFSSFICSFSKKYLHTHYMPRAVQSTARVVVHLATQSCPTLCDPMDWGLPGFFVRGDSSGQEYWSGLPCPSPGDLPDPGIVPGSPALQADSLPAELPGKPMQSMGKYNVGQDSNLPSKGFQ